MRCWIRFGTVLEVRSWEFGVKNRGIFQVSIQNQSRMKQQSSFWILDSDSWILIFIMYFILYSFVYLLSWIPRPLGLRLGDFIGGVLYKMLTRRREIALNNLAVAFGDQKSPEEREGHRQKELSKYGSSFF